MSELARIKAAMAAGEHTDGDLQWCVDALEAASAEGGRLRDVIYRAYAELTETHGTVERNLEEACKILKPDAWARCDELDAEDESASNRQATEQEKRAGYEKNRHWNEGDEAGE